MVFRRLLSMNESGIHQYDPDTKENSLTSCCPCHGRFLKPLTCWYRDTSRTRWMTETKRTHPRTRHSEDENEMNNAAPVLTSFEMKNVMESMRGYLDAHSNGEMNKMDEIKLFAHNLILKKTI
ncbi:hypothetical protein TNCV_3707921 [Trichonephila clavipes]|nr:hypothetical protein TNCV_3707921 [Trichonephila clavipes]